MKILVADDSQVLRTAVTRLLEPAGYEVATAVDGVEAITRFYEERPDLVLLDVQMPKLIGYVVCRLIKDDPAVAHVPVLILTARDSEEDRYWGEQSGADGYITKDALGDGLIAKIRSLLASQALRSLSVGDADPRPSLGETDVLTRVCEMLDRKLFEATVVNELTSIGTTSMELRASVDETLRSARRLVAFDIGAVIMMDDLTVFYRPEFDLSAEEHEFFLGRLARKVRTALDGDKVWESDLNLIHLTETLLAPSEGDGELSSIYIAPLRVRDSVVALFALGAQRGGVFNDAAVRTLRTIEPAMAAVIDSGRRYQEAIIKEASSSLSALND